MADTTIDGVPGWLGIEGVDVKDTKTAGIGLGAIITGLGLLLISPFIDGFNFIGLLVTLIGLVGFGGFAKGKWY